VKGTPFHPIALQGMTLIMLLIEQGMTGFLIPCLQDQGRFLGPALLTFGLVLGLTLGYYFIFQCPKTHRDRCIQLRRMLFLTGLLFLFCLFFSDSF
jgi:hypothetical protein